ncbi:MAG TPA: NBR1-Ig-like domain-containing protein [Anaerolineales bacterium]|nr:NBR1-Ig-like domain-containing protein [Anaerolineales bacterium]
MKPIRHSIILMIFLGLLLVSCGGQNEVLPTPDLSSILTVAVGTVVESVFQTQTAIAPPSVPTVTPTISPTPTPIVLSPIPSSTFTPIVFNPVITYPSPTPTGTQYTPTPNPSTLAYGCNNLRLLRDETIPAGTVMLPGQTFTKAWKVENNGTCNWVYQYQLVFISGERMGGEPPRLNKVIEPGKWTQLSIDLTAPTKPGTYTGYWRLGDQQGHPFGSTLTVQIVVSHPTDTPVPPTATPVTPSETP